MYLYIMNVEVSGFFAPAGTRSFAAPFQQVKAILLAGEGSTAQEITSTRAIKICKYVIFDDKCLRFIKK